MRRIERLINLIAALLETREPMTAGEIRTQVAGYDQADNENFRRTFERDKEALRAMGIPLELRPTDPFVDQNDGYIIPKELYYLPQLDLEEDELAALRIAAGVVLGAGDAARSAFMKLAIDDAGGPGDGPGIVWGADLAAEQAALTPLHHALLARTPVRFEYLASGSASPEARTVEPYGLLHRRGHWYLVAFDRGRDATRSFKVSRIEGTVVTIEGSFEIPPDFDPASHVAEGWEIGGDDATPTVKVRFHPEMRWWAEQNLRQMPQQEAGGALDVDMAVANLDALVSWAIDLGDGVEILAPESARAALRERLEPWLGAGARA